MLVFATYGSYAISNDEEVQQRYGELIVAYYASGFTDQSLFHFVNLYLYGGLFDVIAVLTERALPFIDPYTIRHLLCAFIGIGGIGAAYATARLVAGPRAGAIAAFALGRVRAVVRLDVQPHQGHPVRRGDDGRDLFPAARRARPAAPAPARRDRLRASARRRARHSRARPAAGRLCRRRAAHAGVPRPGRLREQLRFFAESILAFVPAFVIGYVIMIAAWPWSALAPLNPLRGLIDFGEFHYEIHTLLGGHIYTMADVPRWYVPAYLAIKLPPMILIGAALSLWLSCAARSATRHMALGNARSKPRCSP